MWYDGKSDTPFLKQKWGVVFELGLEEDDVTLIMIKIFLSSSYGSVSLGFAYAVVVEFQGQVRLRTLPVTTRTVGQDGFGPHQSRPVP